MELSLSDHVVLVFISLFQTQLYFPLDDLLGAMKLTVIREVQLWRGLSVLEESLLRLERTLVGNIGGTLKSILT